MTPPREAPRAPVRAPADPRLTGSSLQSTTAPKGPKSAARSASLRHRRQETRLSPPQRTLGHLRKAIRDRRGPAAEDPRGARSRGTGCSQPARHPPPITSMLSGGFWRKSYRSAAPASWRGRRARLSPRRQAPRGPRERQGRGVVGRGSASRGRARQGTSQSREGVYKYLASGHAAVSGTARASQVEGREARGPSRGAAVRAGTPP